MSVKIKILTLVGTRPEIIKLSLVIKELDRFCDHVLVHSGQNFDYELSEIFFNELEIKKPNYFLNSAGATSIETITNIIKRLDEVLDKEKPDAFLVYGDTNTCLGVIAAKKRKIPIFHLEAGNRCFDQRVPEEINRKIVDHLSDINLVHSEHARRYLIAEGILPDTIIKSGSPMSEVLEYYKDKIEGSDVLDRLKLNNKDYFILSSHREENVDNPVNFKNLQLSIERLINVFKKRIIFSTHPRTRKKLEESGLIRDTSTIEYMKPLGFFDYIWLQKNAFCVLSDSGTLTEESSLLQFPGVMIRETHERPEGMDRAVVVMSDLLPSHIERAVKLVTAQKFNPLKISDYDSTDVSKKLVRTIYSYTDYINRTVWKKTIED